MDEVTQQNAALVEQAGAAATSLNDEAAALARVVSVFNLGDAAASAPVAKPGMLRATPASPRSKAPAPKRLAAARQNSDEWETF
jgi:methyl-accepting chemotaxis protein